MLLQLSFCDNDAVCCEGALPLVVAFLDLDQGWKEGRYALRILYNLCAPAMDPGGQHANLLARLHAVRRLSDVLCTVQPFKEHMKAAGVVVTIPL